MGSHKVVGTKVLNRTKMAGNKLVARRAAAFAVAILTIKKPPAGGSG